MRLKSIILSKQDIGAYTHKSRTHGIRELSLVVCSASAHQAHV